MFVTLRNKLKDVGTLSALCKGAEQVARADGKEAPGSEHFVLASLSLPDGTAQRAFAQLGATAESFQGAIRAQFAEALRHAGLQAAAESGLPAQRAPNTPRLYRAAPSGESLVQRLAAKSGHRQGRSLLAADVLLAVAEEEFSIAARALRVLGITPQQLIQRANREIASQTEQRGAA